ncbi:MAG: hypothetical protein JSV33_01095 [bacterium]|nr:MAG: hypothetical protein JSV33_01095 [bacterium]
MLSVEQTVEGIDTVAGRIVDRSIRRLFVTYCSEILLFSDSIDIAIAAFDVRLSGPGGFSVIVAPYRELFRVSVGSGRSCDIRVDGREPFVTALDLAMRHHLDSLGRQGGHTS